MPARFSSASEFCCACFIACGGRQLPRGDVLDRDVDLLVDLRIHIDRPVFHVALCAEGDRVEIDLDDVVPIDSELALEFRALDQRAPGDRAVAALDDHLADDRLRHRPGDELPGRVLVLRARRNAPAMRRDAGKPPLRPGRTHREIAGARDLAVLGAHLHEKDLTIGRVVGAAGLERGDDLVVGVGDHAVRTVVTQQLGRRNRPRRSLPACRAPASNPRAGRGTRCRRSPAERG